MRFGGVTLVSFIIVVQELYSLTTNSQESIILFRWCVKLSFDGAKSGTMQLVTPEQTQNQHGHFVHANGLDIYYSPPA